MVSLLPADSSYRLPLRVIVPVGVPLSVVLEQTAGALELSVSELLGWIGVPRIPDPPSRIDDPPWLNPAQLARLAQITGVPEKSITNANLSFFDAALASSKRQRATVSASRRTHAAIIGALRVRHSTRLCPRCLAEGRQKRLAWRTGWLFACTRHRVLLVATCPRCGLPFDAHCRQSRVPDLRRCDNHPAKGEKCEQLLSDIPTVNIDGFPELIRSQGRLEAALTGRTLRFVGQRTTPVEYLYGLKELVDVLEAVAVVGELGELPPEVLNRFEAQVRSRAVQWQRRNEHTPDGLSPAPFSSESDIELLSAVVSTALEIADSKSLQAAEDRMMYLIESCCAVAADEPRRILNAITRHVQRQRRPRLYVAFRELYDRVRHRYKLYE